MVARPASGTESAPQTSTLRGQRCCWINDLRIPVGWYRRETIVGLPGTMALSQGHPSASDWGWHPGHSPVPCEPVIPPDHGRPGRYRHAPRL